MRAFSLLEVMIAVVIAGVLAGLGGQGMRRSTCAAQEREAMIALRAAQAIEEAARAEHGRYVALRARCSASQLRRGQCAVWSASGAHPRFTVTATATATTFTATAAGIRGTRMANAIWRTNERGVLTDVSRICRRRRA